MSNFEKINTRDQIVSELIGLSNQLVQATTDLEIIDTVKLDSIKRDRDALNAKELKMVVIGEFSRGKSSLINAFLGQPILPYHLKQTTAVNTIIRGVSPGEDPYIELEFFEPRPDGSTLQRVEYCIEELRRWGTELDRDNSDNRRGLKYIRIYTDQSLFQNRLEMIDTPGFNGVLPHHQEIAHAAMRDAHVAIWIQAADQLGATSSEWTFLREHVAEKFNQFLTVVNKWDLVVEPGDHYDLMRPLAEREAEAIDEVRYRFIEQTQDLNLPPEKLKVLTSSDHILGASATWAISEDPERRERSRIKTLIRRIEEISLSGQSEVLLTPLKRLINDTSYYQKQIKSERDDLNSDASLLERQDLLKRLSFEIQKISLDKDNRIMEARREHEHHARSISDKITAIVGPLSGVRLELEESLTIDFVHRLVKRAAQTQQEHIELPSDLLGMMEDALNDVQQNWPGIQTEAEEILHELTSDFLEGFSEYARTALSGFDVMNLELPNFELSAGFDLSTVQGYYEQQIELQEKLEIEREELNILEDRLQNAQFDKENADNSREEMKHKVMTIEGQISGLGPQPPIDYETKYKTKKGMYKNKQVSYQDPDDSRRKAYKRHKSDLESKLQNQESLLEQVKSEALEKRRKVLTEEQAQRKRTQLVRRMERELKVIEEQGERDELVTVERIHRLLRRHTLRRLERIEQMIAQEASQAIMRAFQDNIEHLSQTVDENFISRLKEKEDEKQRVLDLIAQDEQAVQDRIAKLNAGSEQLKELSETMRYYYDEKIPALLCI